MDKICSNCGEVKPLEDFYVQSSRKDGRQRYCKICDKKSSILRAKKPENKAKEKKWRQENKEKVNATSRNWRDKNRDKVNNYAKKYLEENRLLVKEGKLRQKLKYPITAKARNLTTNAIREGKLKRLPCEYPGCKGGLGQAHHKDYGMPLDITWLCSYHHALADRVKKMKDKYIINRQPC